MWVLWHDGQKRNLAFWSLQQWLQNNVVRALQWELWQVIWFEIVLPLLEVVVGAFFASCTWRRRTKTSGGGKREAGIACTREVEELELAVAEVGAPTGVSVRWRLDTR